MRTTNKIRIVLATFIALLLLSGVTAFPIQTEMNFLTNHLSSFPVFLQNWILEVATVTKATPNLMFYGTDWLAFAHIIIALFFMPVFTDPVKHKANIIIGMIACLAVFPLAFICGPIRGIPFFHQLIDCSFGVGGILLLYYVIRQINVLEKNKNTYAN